MDRINQIGEREHWPATLTLEGFTWDPQHNELADEGAPTSSHTHRQHNFRWLLKRFVEPDWINTPASRTTNTSG